MLLPVSCLHIESSCKGPDTGPGVPIGSILRLGASIGSYLMSCLMTCSACRDKEGKDGKKKKKKDENGADNGSNDGDDDDEDELNEDEVCVCSHAWPAVADAWVPHFETSQAHLQ